MYCVGLGMNHTSYTATPCGTVSLPPACSSSRELHAILKEIRYTEHLKECRNGRPVPEFLDPVFAKTGSINSGTGMIGQDHGLNMDLDLQILFGLLCTAILIG